ncbi:NDR1/HIN1-like protein 13 [Durio zibethinus]|uniref:NDR1/HIN1-like protein 13 n=1 Tax=Durio zibethinus TaxID=66656 RepID=A0A6P5YKE3_DURZI|nr:NDR1/HIN1-like protein 13 [Durio zibethinus]
MEERVASSAGEPRLQSSRAEPTPNNDDNDLSLQLARPPTPPLSTYVIQVPKDQIYRVPPPENARIVESHRQAAKASVKNKKRPFSKYLIGIAILLVVIGLMIAVTLTVIYRSFTPKAPVFSVSKLNVKQHKDGSPPTYDITLKVKNPNEKMGIKYGSVEDDVKLTFWKKTLGGGQFPSFYQNGGDLNLVHVKLNGPEDQTVPPNVQRSMNDKKPKHQISLVLNFNSPLLLNVWIFKMWSRDMDVKCNFRVSTMGKGTKILNQHCKTKLSQ